MLIAKISFYFESAKKTGEKFREKLGFQNHCPQPISSTQQVSRHDEGSIRPPLIVAYRPLSFPVKCGGIYVYWAPYTPCPAQELNNLYLLWNWIDTCNRLEVIIEEYSSIMFVTTTIIFNNISSPTIPTFFVFATIHDFLVF